MMSEKLWIEEAEWAVGVWNRFVRVGDDVDVTLDDGSKRRTKTRSEAWVAAGGMALVQVEGIGGGFRLSRVMRK